jgi:hypothetical protein
VLRRHPTGVLASGLKASEKKFEIVGEKNGIFKNDSFLISALLSFFACLWL